MFRKQNNHCECYVDYLKENLDEFKKVANCNHKELKDTIKNHIDKEEIWQNKIEKWHKDLEIKAIQCPESPHIMAQNGKIDNLAIQINHVKNEVCETRGTVKMWCYIFAALLASLALGTFVAQFWDK